MLFDGPDYSKTLQYSEPTIQFVSWPSSNSEETLGILVRADQLY